MRTCGLPCSPHVQCTQGSLIAVQPPDKTHTHSNSLIGSPSSHRGTLQSSPPATPSNNFEIVPTTTPQGT